MTPFPKAMDIVRLVRASGYEAERPDINSNITAQLQCSDTSSAVPSDPDIWNGTAEAMPTATAFPTETPVPSSTP
jgi:hypothetical protein